MTDFVHLHCHTEYSLLDGAIKIDDLCARTAEMGLPAAAITDHGNLFGAVQFYTTAKEYGIKPVIGCEVYVAKGDRREKDARSASDAGYHLVLLAENRLGYHNLIKLVSLANLEGFYYKPRVDKELLAQFNQGLFALSGCLKGEVPAALMQRNMDAARQTLREYTQLFPERFYLELQANGIPEQETLNERLLQLSEDSGVPVVATNDCHYLTSDDVEAHDILLCIQTNATVNDAKRMKLNTDRLYLRPPEEMRQAFSHCPQALSNAAAIAEACNVELDLGKPRFPAYTPPSGLSLEEEFRRLAREGLKERLGKLPYSVNEEDYWDRLSEEMDVICRKGFAGYFLIVQDFINWAKSRSIPVGPGRGSAAGSLAAYALGITNIDPLKYNLLFERFLNVERESLPDIDVDFCYHRREEVIRYVTEKYGKDCVAQITTFGTMKAKAVVRDVGRALGMSFAETDKIAKLIPDDLKITIDKALEREPDLQQKAEEDERVAKLLDVSRRLEGLARHASTHAAGIVISDRPMQEYLPLYQGKKGEVVTQFDMKRVEKVGLIKFDFLGLKTLTVLSDALDMARESGKEIPDLDNLPLDDPQTYAMLCKGRTDGVFQLESSGMRRVMMDLKPGSFEDVIALLALYRPGPLESGMVTDFIRRKHGEVEVEYPHPKLEPVLRETYGVILYQEQVMRIASVLAGYSLGDGDLLRRAMGKKKARAMAEQRSKFLQGAKENDIPEETAEHLFGLIEKFAGYGFNKSHSAAYAMISYQTAYMKAHYPQEFMAALLTSEENNTDKVLSYINACREMGISVLAPDINQSVRAFAVEGENIRFGLSAVKNVGDGAIEEILRKREQKGPYRSLYELCRRINLRKTSKRVLESLIKSGAMDCFGVPRAALLASLDKVVATAQKKSREKATRQLSLLNMVQEEHGERFERTGVGLDVDGAEVEEWPEEQRLKAEKEVLGFFLTGHPLLRYKLQLSQMQVRSLQACTELAPETEVQVAFLVTGCKEIQTRKGDRMAFCQVEDLTATAEVTMFPEVYKSIRNGMDFDQPLLCKARISDYKGEGQGGEEAQRQIKLLAREVEPLAHVENTGNGTCHVPVRADCLRDGSMARLKEILNRYPGSNPVQLIVYMQEAVCRLQLGPDFCVRPGPDFWKDIQDWAADPEQERAPGRETSPAHH